MSKRITKIIVLISAAAMLLGALAIAGCAPKSDDVKYGVAVSPMYRVD